MADYTQHSEPQLAELFRSGDDGAFREIYQRYDRLLFLFAVKKLGDDQEAKDVIQDVFVWILDHRDTFALKSSLSSYLYKAVLNRIFDIFRHQKVIRRFIDLGEHFIEIDSTESDHLIREKDIRAMIDAEIAAMPPRMREIYALKHYQGLKKAAIAEKLGLSEHSVKEQLRRGSSRLRTKLGLLIYVLYILRP